MQYCEYSPGKELAVLIVFYEMIVDLISNQKPCQIVAELYLKGRKLNVSLIFSTVSYLTVPKDVTLNSMPFLL